MRKESAGITGGFLFYVDFFADWVRDFWVGYQGATGVRGAPSLGASGDVMYIVYINLPSCYHLP